MRDQLCLDIGVPPVDAHSFLPEPEGTTRAYLEQATAGPECRACHEFVDPAGLSFESFDELGRYGETQAGQTIDTTGEMRVGPDATLAFGGVRDIMQHLAQSPQAYSCLARKWLAALGLRDGGWGGWQCSAQQAARATCETGDLVQLLSEVATTEVFRFVGSGSGTVLNDEPCAPEGSHDCRYLAEHTGVSLEECLEYQGKACNPEADDLHPSFPCIGGITVIRGCCSDDECRRIGAAPFCGRATAPHGLCVTNDAL